MASAVAGMATQIDISLIPSIGMPLLLSLVTVAVGVAAYRAIDRMREAIGAVLVAIGWGPDKGFDQFIAGMVRLSFRTTAIIQPGRLDFYMKATFLFIALAILVPMVVFGELPQWPAMPEEVHFHELAIVLIGMVGLLAVLIAKDRLTAIVSLGIQGFSVALIFMLFGAPDLSFTQFMVETLSVVILALVMTRLRLYPSDYRPARERVVSGAIAISSGLAFMLYLLKVTQGTLDLRLTEFFNEFSKPIAHGGNIVNVILVDFRGTDTLGEISVVMIAGLAILALLRVRTRRRPRDLDQAPEPDAAMPAPAPAGGGA
jgi:multicomponent Na+:H+ antiporter subunit A